jgi:hypothetical protein
MQQETHVSGFIFALLSTVLNTTVAWLALFRIYEIPGSNVGGNRLFAFLGWFCYQGFLSWKQLRRYISMPAFFFLYSFWFELS